MRILVTMATNDLENSLIRKLTLNLVGLATKTTILSVTNQKLLILPCK